MKFTYDYALKIINSFASSVSSMEVLLSDGTTQKQNVSDFSTQKITYNDTPYLQATFTADGFDFNNQTITGVNLYDSDGNLILSADANYGTGEGLYRVYFDLYIELNE